MKRIAVYCGSNIGARPEYAAAAETLGTQLAREKIALVYGGGMVGLMGIVADAVLQHGGHVIGVIPEKLVIKEVVHEKLPDLRVVKTMHGFAVVGRYVTTNMPVGVLLPAQDRALGANPVELAIARIGHHDVFRRLRRSLVRHADHRG